MTYKTGFVMLKMAEDLKTPVGGLLLAGKGLPSKVEYSLTEFEPAVPLRTCHPPATADINQIALFYIAYKGALA